MIIGKVVTVKGTTDLDEKVNAKIEELKGKFSVVQILKVTGGAMLCLAPVTKHFGYQGKQLADNANASHSMSDPATSKQINYLIRLAHEAGVDLKSTKLTKHQAGQLIGKLKHQIKTQANPEDKAVDDFKSSFNMDDVESLFDNLNR